MTDGNNPKKILVVKYGGRAMLSAELMAAVVQDVVDLRASGVPLVLVHGGSSDIERLFEVFGIESRFVGGLRYTSCEAMELVQMVLCGKVNKNICALIQGSGGRAVGLCGVDGGLLQAERERTLDLGCVGVIRQVNTDLLETLVRSDVIPVVAPVALGLGADAGRTLNINADTAAARIAATLGACELILLTDIDGILRDVRDPHSLMRSISASELRALKAEGGVIAAGMIPKVDGCLAAIDCGVAKVRIVDGRVPHILRECLGGHTGTLISA